MKNALFRPMRLTVFLLLAATMPLMLAATSRDAGAQDLKGGTLRANNLLDHPATGEEPLDGRRKAIAILTLAMFVLLFMPEPFSM